MTVKLLTETAFGSLGGCTGTSESTLVKMPHCWKSRHSSYVMAFKLLKMLDALWLNEKIIYSEIRTA